MKRKLSLLMVLMMVLTLIPAMPSFATSENKSSFINTSADGEVDLTLTIKPTTQFVTGKSFEIELGEGAEFADPSVVTTNGAILLAKRTKTAEFTPATTGGTITITATVKLDGAPAGEQVVTITDINGSGVSREPLTYAFVIGSGDLLTRTLESKKTVTRGIVTGAEFEIREANRATLTSGKTITMKLPKDITWESGTTVFVNNAPVTATLTTTGSRDITFTLPSTVTSSAIDRIIVKPVMNITRDARLGDIDVDFTGTYSIESVTVAEYVDYGVTVKVDKVKEIIAGRPDTNKDYEVKVTLDTAGASFNTNRPIDFTVDGGELKLKNTTNTNVTKASITTAKYTDEFEAFAIDASKDIEMTFYVTSEWDNTKEVTLTVQGGGVDEQTVKLADVLAPAKIEVKKVEDYRIGVQGQVGSEIVITETKAGSLAEGYYVIDFDKTNFGVTFTRPVATVETGNIDVDRNITSDGSKIWVRVKAESTKEPAVIKLNGYTVSLDRTVPEGDLKAKFAWVGSSYATNALRDDAINEVRDHEKITNFVIGRVITNAPDAMRQTTVFTLDSTTYTVGGVEMTLDAAPYISNNRTMLPIGTVARLAGASVNYSAETRTAVFTKDNLVVSMNLDTNILLVNGSPVPMDAKPEIVNGRAFVPVVFVAQAFGIQNGTDIVYDAATRSVTLFPNAQ